MVVADSSVLNVREIPQTRSSYARFKLAGDIVLSAVLLLPGLPVLLLLGILVRLTSRGPAIFRQVRVGLNGRPFVLYKFRTMCHDAESRTGPVWAQRDDPRVTRFGGFLRRTHLDELPQLFNVLRGDMCLVGPRPERPEFVSKLAAVIPGYLDRLSVRPGITGLAQVYLPPDSDPESVQRKLSYDVYYVQFAGPVVDLKLLGCTALRLLGVPGWVAQRLVRLNRFVRPLWLRRARSAAVTAGK
ncbi:MAG: sugar transferase [Planctomycetes bacterium]|nr:sugar transferase [Planctomycetota bacterium]